MAESNSEAFQILKLLIENHGSKFSIRHISKKRKINYKSAYNAIQNLEKEGIINVEKVGNTKICSFNRKFSPRVFAVEYERRKELMKNKNFAVIFSQLEKLHLPFVMLLFGSYAKGTATKHSDIDLLAITEHEKEIEREISLMPLNIHLTSVTYKDFLQMAKSKEFTVVSEAMKKNIILLGIEEYYRLISNAG